MSDVKKKVSGTIKKAKENIVSKAGKAKNLAEEAIKKVRPFQNPYSGRLQLHAPGGSGKP